MDILEAESGSWKLTVVLIGAHKSWTRPVIDTAKQERFASALAIANPRPAASCIAANTVMFATGQHRAWQAHTLADGSHVLFSGHIANRHQLRNELKVASCSDASLYAAGLAAWGNKIDLRAIGQFASIIVRPEGSEIQIARSPIAAPPLNYWHDKDRFIVSSIASAIFSTGEIEQRLDQQKIADTLLLNYNEGARSWFEGVSRLDCGHRAIITKQGVTTASFYDVSAIPKVRFKDDRDYRDAVRELLEEGVRSALDGFSRPAICLSGGFDSQAVAAYAARCRPGRPIEAFTSVPEAEWDGVIGPTQFGNERPQVDDIASLYSEIRPHWVDAKGLFFDHKLTSMFALTGGAPRNAANLHWIHEAYAQARSSGCDVMLNGNLGNVTLSFDGEGALATMARSGKWLSLWQEAGYFKSSHRNSRLRAIASRAILPFAPDWLHDILVRVGLIKATMPFETWCPLHPRYAAKTKVMQRAKALGYDPFYRYPSSSHTWREEMLTLGTQDTGDIYQAFDIIHNMETRDPTSYRPLVEFCLGIPDDQFVRGGETRRLARKVLKGAIPDTVLDEKRKGLQGADWLLRLGRQRVDLIAEIDRLSEDADIAEILNLGAMRQSLVDWPQSPRGLPTMQLQQALTRGLTTARFIRFVKRSNS